MFLPPSTQVAENFPPRSLPFLPAFASEDPAIKLVENEKEFRKCEII
jgi:hypothetical protein